MVVAELAQTRTTLREQAMARRYDAAAVRNLESGCDFATLLSDGLYRPDGRPFLMSLIGAASVLVRYDLRLEVVLAGLTHAAYSHRPPWLAESEVTRMLASGGETDTIVRGLPTATAWVGSDDARALTGIETVAVAVEAAILVDRRLAGEDRALGRAAKINARLADALAPMGLTGLAASAAVPAAGDALVQGPILGRAPPYDSFRLDARGRRLLPASAPSA